METDEHKLKRKVSFTLQAVHGDDPFAADCPVPDDAEAALRWQQARSPEAVMKVLLLGCLWLGSASLRMTQEREAIVCRIEQRAAELWGCGDCGRWFSGADEGVRRVALTMNGPLMEEAARAVGYGGKSCFRNFKKGVLTFAFAVLLSCRSGRCCKVDR